MPHRDETNFVWRPLESPTDRRWIGAASLIAISAVIGFAAGTSWTSRSASPERSASVGEANGPSAARRAMPPHVAKTPAPTPPEKPKAYVVINPGAVSGGGDVHDHTPSEPKEGVNGTDMGAGGRPEVSTRTSGAKRAPSGVPVERSRPKLDNPASNYMGLRDYVLKPH